MRTQTFLKSAIAAAVALSTVTTLATPSLAAARHHHRTPGYDSADPAPVYVNHPGILHPTARQLGWGNRCMEDDGQGRYFPCDAGGS
jgi:hypothetical protein